MIVNLNTDTAPSPKNVSNKFRIYIFSFQIEKNYKQNQASINLSVGSPNKLARRLDSVSLAVIFHQCRLVRLIDARITHSAAVGQKDDKG